MFDFSINFLFILHKTNSEQNKRNQIRVQQQYVSAVGPDRGGLSFSQGTWKKALEKVEIKIKIISMKLEVASNNLN